jgi:hypothetical protein
MESFSAQHVVEKVVENGQVLKDVDYSTYRHGPHQFVVQGYNRNVPFVLTNMTPQALRRVYRQTPKPTRRRRTKGLKKNRSKSSRKK